MLVAAILVVLNTFPNDPRGAYDICVTVIEQRASDHPTVIKEEFYFAQEACEYVLNPYLEVDDEN